MRLHSHHRCFRCASSRRDGDCRFLHVGFSGPREFRCWQVHRCFTVWDKIASLAPYNNTSTILRWIQNSVSVFDFFQPFQGDYKGSTYNSALPPSQVFPNSYSCKPFAQFISDTIMQRLATGAISVWGKVHQVAPPHLVMPLTVEASKPRLCNDNRFLNLWIKDTPFRLDSLTYIPRYVPPSFQSVCDDKSGYDHVFLTPESRTFFGFQRAGWYFVSNTIPFGWKSSAYIYHTIGLLASHYFRSISIPCSLYIDDRHVGELLRPDGSAYLQFESEHERSFARASSAIFLVCLTLQQLGYCLSRHKSILVPRQVVPYLGFSVDSKSRHSCYRKKSEKNFFFFCSLNFLLQLKSNAVDVKTLQRFAGECLSFAIAVRCPPIH